MLNRAEWHELGACGRCMKEARCKQALLAIKDIGLSLSLLLLLLKLL